MRRFTYVWKSSDGERRVGEMSARRKDDVFAVLREQGVRPIKVEVVPRSWRWWAAWGAAAAIACAVPLAAIHCRTAEQRAKAEAFREAGEAIILQSNEQIAALRLGEPGGGKSPGGKLGSAARAIDIARTRLRLAYRDFGGKDIPAGERLYGHFMSVLDEKEEALEAWSDKLDE